MLHLSHVHIHVNGKQQCSLSRRLSRYYTLASLCLCVSVHGVCDTHIYFVWSFERSYSYRTPLSECCCRFLLLFLLLLFIISACMCMCMCVRIRVRARDPANKRQGMQRLKSHKRLAGWLDFVFFLLSCFFLCSLRTHAARSGSERQPRLFSKDFILTVYSHRLTLILSYCKSAWRRAHTYSPSKLWHSATMRSREYGRAHTHAYSHMLWR